MPLKALTVGAAALVWAVPAAAQRRGTMEFGAFASAASFDNKLSLKTGYGVGGRVGMFLVPRVSIVRRVQDAGEPSEWTEERQRGDFLRAAGGGSHQDR